MTEIIQPPFHMLISGKTKCGKTQYLVDMLEKDYYQVFENIIIICPTIKYNKTYLNWKYLDSCISIAAHESRIDEAVDIIMDLYKETNTLVILDDVASTQVVKNQVSAINKMAFHGRHIGISSILITQQFTSVANAYRQNISKLVTFYNGNRKVMKDIFDDNGIDLKDREDIIEKLKSVPYSRLEINLEPPYDHAVVSPKRRPRIVKK